MACLRSNMYKGVLVISNSLANGLPVMSISDVAGIACVYISSVRESGTGNKRNSRTGGGGDDGFRVGAGIPSREEYVDELSLACAEMSRIAKYSAVASAAMDRERRGSLMKPMKETLVGI
jgi:hypothetical protein